MGVDQLVTGGDVDNPVVESVRTVQGNITNLRPSASDSRYPRINNWEQPTEVLTVDEVDAGFATNQPKEPACIYHNGTYYLAVAVWDSYGGPSDKEVVLLSSSSPDSGFAQVCQVTSNIGVYMHAPGIIVDDSDELWVFFSNKDGGTNNIEAKHAPIGALPSTPGGWTAERDLISATRDPGPVRADDGTYYIFATSENGSHIERYESSDLISWSNQTTVFDNNAVCEGPDFIPRFDGEGVWLIIGAHRPGTSFNNGLYQCAAAKGDSITDDTFDGPYVYASKGRLGEYEPTFLKRDLRHMDYTRENSGYDLHTANGGTVAYFEASAGSDWHIGVAQTTENYETQQAYLGSEISARLGLNANRNVGGSINFDLPLMDRGGGGAGAGSYQAPEPGVYRVRYRLNINNITDGDDIQVTLVKGDNNGGEVFGRERKLFGPSGGGYETMTVESLVELNKAEKISEDVLVISSTNTLEYRSGQIGTMLEVQRVG